MQKIYTTIGLMILFTGTVIAQDNLLKELENESPDKPSEAKKEEKVEGSK